VKIVILAPKNVKRAVSGPISAWDPRKNGPLQRILLENDGFAGLMGEEAPAPRVLECRWELDRDTKTAARQWKVSVGPADVVAELDKSLSHHFDDPLDVR